MRALLLVAWLACSSSPAPAVPRSVGARWPISNRAVAGGDAIRDPYGPRLNGGAYDFHAGIDIAARRGTPVHAVLPGTVIDAVSDWGAGIGSGNKVLVEHDGRRYTSYLHLDTVAVTVGQRLAAGDVVGTVGDTGARDAHLHLTYMIDLPAATNDERRSRNPLELLPHAGPRTPALAIAGGVARLRLSVQDMTLQAIELADASHARSVDYRDIVALGSVARDGQVQRGIAIEVTEPSDGTFELALRVAPPDFEPTRMTLTDIHGATWRWPSR